MPPPDDHSSTVLDFTIQQQQQTHWCWAAVVSSILQYYNPAYPSQQEIVTRVLRIQGAGYSRYFNSAGVIDKPLHIYRLLNKKVKGQVTLNNIVQQLTNHCPVGIRIGWQEGGGHFAVIYGCKTENGHSTLYIADPLHGTILLSYTDFKKEYAHSGYWTHTYYIRG